MTEQYCRRDDLAPYSTDRFNFRINNAGTSRSAPVAETTEAQFDEMLNVYLKGVYFLPQQALPPQRDGGRLVTIFSTGVRSAFAGVSAYATIQDNRTG